MIAYHGSPMAVTTTTAKMISDWNEGNDVPTAKFASDAANAPDKLAKNAEMQNTNICGVRVDNPPVSSAIREYDMALRIRPSGPLTINAIVATVPKAKRRRTQKKPMSLPNCHAPMPPL